MQAAGLTTAAAGAAGLAGYFGIWQPAQGEPLPHHPPFAEPLARWRLTTAPILVLLPDEGVLSFGLYLAELLCLEGVNAFRVARWAELGPGALEAHALVVLVPGPLGTAAVERLTAYVAGGGRLMALRPEAALAEVLGVEPAGGALTDGYLHRASGQALAQGLPAVSLQYHGPADRYRLAGAQAVAWLGDRAAPTEAPAVAIHTFGRGRAVLWAYDLAHSVALTRQGNPEWANQERDGREGLRAQDMFVGWMDLDRLAVPQADEQLRLLTRLLTELLAEALPLPRLGYFPGAAPGVLVATGDSHQNPAAVIETVLQRLEQRGGRLTVYYAPELSSNWRRAVRRGRSELSELPGVRETLNNPTAAPTAGHIQSWQGRGHEFGVHPYVEEGLEAGWQTYWREFTGLGYGPLSPTTRTHRILWTGWVETALVQAAYGIRMNLDYYHNGPAFQKPDGEWVFGHYTGSGLPAKFVDAAGRVVNTYQQLTQLVDEHLLTVPWGGGWPGLSPDEAVAVSRRLMDESLAGAHGALAAQFHVDPFLFGGQYAADAGRWLDGTLDAAAERGLPIWTAQDWLNFTELRHDAGFTDLRWEAAANTLTFQLEAEAAPGLELAVMVPQAHGRLRLDRLEVDGAAVTTGVRSVGGVAYGWAALAAGPHQVTARYAA
ncbi:MAG: hypothetical protein JNK29_15285 [Anaerolineales bacterium]|nr:hypothetical protein [Anaerolineales bacterium]